MAGWVVPIALYVLILGASGVTTKLALETISWQQLVLWVPICYGVIAVFLVAASGTELPLGRGGFWALLTALCAASALILFFYALTKGDVSLVVPISGAYPVVTLIGSTFFLSESITWSRVAGTLLVIAGVFVIGRFG